MRYLVLFFSVMLVIASCKKPVVLNPTREELLKDGKWNVVSGTETYKLPSGVDTTFSIVIQDCSKDNSTIFRSNNIVAFYSGASKCYNEPDSVLGNWELLNNASVINFYNVSAVYPSDQFYGTLTNFTGTAFSMKFNVYVPLPDSQHLQRFDTLKLVYDYKKI